MKKILVPTDLTEIANLGLQLAVEISKRCGASIILVNFTRHPFGKTFSTTGEVNLGAADENVFTLEFLHAIKEKLAAIAAAHHAEGVSVEYAVIDDEFRNGIDTYLSEQQIDLIVMGTSGEETFKENFTGNHTLQVIKISSCPVLSVRDGFNTQDFANIVAAVCVVTDNQVADGLRRLASLAACFNSHVHLVHVRDKAGDSNLILDEYFTRMANIANLKRFSVTILDSDERSEAVLQYANQVKAGLIAVLKNSPDGIFRIFSNKFSDIVLKEEGRPVFTLNLNNT